MHLLNCLGERQVVFCSWHCIFVLLVWTLILVGRVVLLNYAYTMERLLWFVALLTGIALVSLDWSWMQFPTVGLRMSRQDLELHCRLGAYFRVIAGICDQWSNTGFVVWGLIAFVWWLYVFARWDAGPDVYLGISPRPLEVAARCLIWQVDMSAYWG